MSAIALATVIRTATPATVTVWAITRDYRDHATGRNTGSANPIIFKRKEDALVEMRAIAKSYTYNDKTVTVREHDVFNGRESIFRIEVTRSQGENVLLRLVEVQLN